jgi:hypothetical protein
VGLSTYNLWGPLNIQTEWAFQHITWVGFSTYNLWGPLNIHIIKRRYQSKYTWFPFPISSIFLLIMTRTYHNKFHTTNIMKSKTFSSILLIKCQSFRQWSCSIVIILICTSGVLKHYNNLFHLKGKKYLLKTFWQKLEVFSYNDMYLYISHIFIIPSSLSVGILSGTLGYFMESPWS